MRILFDARKLFDGGIGRYSRDLLSGLSQIKDISLGAIVSRDFIPTSFPPLKRAKLFFSSARGYSLRELCWLGRSFNRADFDIYHSPHYVLPGSLSIRSVLTVHDLIHITHPEKKYYPFLARYLMNNSFRRASRIIVGTRATGELLKSEFDGSLIEKTRVVEYGHSFIDADLIESQNSQPPNLGRYLLVVVSQNKPHKGLSDLVVAFRKLFAEKRGQELFDDCKLVIVGYGAEKLLQPRWMLKEESKQLVVLGAVADDILGELYKNSWACVLPSLAEGYGYPALEALRFNKPVICRPLPSLKEFLETFKKHHSWSPKFIFADDFTVSALTKALLSFAEAARLVESMGGADRVNPVRFSDFFSARRMAEDTLAIYKEAIYS
ncbi:MAG TPA: glycosyltransferase family 1 protein [Oligoflexia bacterium]|nr:glycosyltransferase family 1 protein [Oligoflexia bacterium]HMP27749.1 glycosyltransferase family 1 protein [Oligoflexia bacterium]